MAPDDELLTIDQAKNLARLVHSLRPSWDPPGILAELGRARPRGNRFEVAEAAIRAAGNRAYNTPAGINFSSNWTRSGPGPSREQARRQPLHRGEQECPTHLGERLEACRGCAADRLAWDADGQGDDQADDQGVPPSEDVARQMTRLRAAVRSGLTRHRDEDDVGYRSDSDLRLGHAGRVDRVDT